jgi:UDP-glucose 4-epimerase
MRAIIPTILAQFIFNSGKINLGNLSPRRDFTFVTDTADAVRSLVSGDIEYGRVIQLGTGKAYSVEDIVKACEEISGTEAQIQIQDFRLRPEKSEIEILLSNPSVANDLLNWKANIGFKDNLRKTYDWLKSNEHLYGQSESYFT